jgi:transglutaminase-like putative cysteine protease
MLRSAFLYCLFVWAAGSLSLAQPGLPLLDELGPIVYGEVDPQWLDMDSYEPESGADAVILADIGQATLQWIGGKQVITYTYHRRIKILTEAGLEAAHFEEDYRYGEATYTKVEASTYGLNPEGEVVAFEVDRRTLRSQIIDRRRRAIIFDFPLVKVGSVIEYIYTYYTDQLDVLRPWVFQQDYPVLHSEFHLILPQTHQYQRVNQGDLRNLVAMEEPIQYQTQSSSRDYTRGLRRLTSTDEQITPQAQTGTDQIYILRHLPSLAQEGFGPQDQGLIPALRFQLSGSAEGDRVPGVFDNWKQLNRQVQYQLKPRKLRAKRSYLQQTARRITRDQLGQQAKAEAIFDWVRNTFAWDSTYSREPTRIDRIIKEGAGNSAGLNMLAILLMREVGLDPQPVLLSTRSNGPVQVVAANLGQFNHLIGGLRIGGTEWLFDVLSQLDEMGVLPREDLNQVGYWLGDAQGDWVRLQSHEQIVRFTYNRFTLSREGLLTGDISLTNQSYSAALERTRFEDLGDNPDPYLRRTLLTGMSDPKVMNYSVENLEASGQPLTISCTLQTRDFVQEIGDLLVIQPMMNKRMTENPFSEEDRAVPVDLTYPLRESYLLGIRIPDGYEVAQLPQPQKVMLPNKAGLFVFNVMEMENILHVSSCIFLNQTVFLPEEYQGIRVFFDYIVRKHAEDIVLKRKAGSE